MGRSRCVRLIVVGAVLVVLGVAANAEPPNAPGLGSRVTDDFKYLIDNVQLDVQDIVTAPLHLTSENGVLRSPRFYLTLAGVGAVWGGAFALDQTMRSHKQGDHSHTAFFRGGASFVSGDVTPMFGLAAGISESFNNAWYVAAPAYSLALLDGFGRMGHDAHWFSDVVGAGLLGWGTTELFLYLHHEHENAPGRWRIFRVTPAPSDASGKMAALPTGLGVEYRW